MRKPVVLNRLVLNRLALGVALAALLAAGSVRAAPVPVADLAFVSAAPGSNSLNLFLSIAPDAPLQVVTALSFHIVSSPTTDFSISPSAIALGVDQFMPAGFSAKIVSGNDLHVSIVGDVLPLFGIAAPGTQNMLIGTLTNAQGVTIDSFVPGVDDGGTILQETFEAIAPYRVTIGDTSRIYPEPAVGLLLALGGGALALTRLRGSHRGHTES